MAAPAIRVEGLREFRRDLRRLHPEVDRELRAELRQVGENVAREASAHAVRRTGRYAASMRAYATGATVSVGSRLPQAGVLHWGGTIRPRGVPIEFPRRPIIEDAAQRQMDMIAEELGHAVEKAAFRVGWRRT